MFRGGFESLPRKNTINSGFKQHQLIAKELKRRMLNSLNNSKRLNQSARQIYSCKHEETFLVLIAYSVLTAVVQQALFYR